MAEVRIETNEDFERALRGFKVQCKKEGLREGFENGNIIRNRLKRRVKRKR